MTRTYSIETQHGDAIAQGIQSEDDARIRAYASADRLGETLYLVSSDGETTEITTRTRRCGCGAWTGERCSYVCQPTDLVLVEWMPEHLRESHESAGASGSYPSNGSLRVRCAEDCAADLLDADPEWSRIVAPEAS